MAELIEIVNLRRGYLEIIDKIRRRGTYSAPRGMPTLEIVDATIVVHEPASAMPFGTGRKFNPAIGAAEALQLIGGFSDPRLMSRITHNFDRFMKNGSFHGAYGPRTCSQLPTVIDKIQNDVDTRQAVVTVWDPLHDAFTTSEADYPCTIALHFIVRGGKLQLHTTMRSNDVWWGLTYDIFQFTQLQYSIAYALGLPVGEYHHHATSLHLYERDMPLAYGLHLPDAPNMPALLDKLAPPDITGIGYHGCPWPIIQTTARAIAAGIPPRARRESESWYVETLAPYLERQDEQ